MTILVDMDDTMVNTTETWVRELNRRYGTAVPYTDLWDWDVSLSFPMLSKEQVFGVLYEDAFWASLRPLPGAVQTLSMLREAGCRVIVATNSHYEGLKVKMEQVLFRYFPFFTWQDVILTAEKQLIKGDLLIDDGVQNLLGGNYEKLLFTAPHNREFDAASNGMRRVNDWEETAAFLREQYGLLAARA